MKKRRLKNRRFPLLKLYLWIVNDTSTRCNLFLNCEAMSILIFIHAHTDIIYRTVKLMLRFSLLIKCFLLVCVSQTNKGVHPFRYFFDIVSSIFLFLRHFFTPPPKMC